MDGNKGYEPEDSRDVTGRGQVSQGHWRKEDTAEKASHGGEYEPKDSRNVTGAASTEDGRWTNDGQGTAESGQEPVLDQASAPED